MQRIHPADIVEDWLRAAVEAVNNGNTYESVLVNIPTTKDVVTSINTFK